MTKTENLTPTHLRCGFGSCPSVHRLEDGRLLIVGTEAETRAVELPSGHFQDQTVIGDVPISDAEEAVFIDPAILATLREEWVREAVEARATGGTYQDDAKQPSTPAEDQAAADAAREASIKERRDAIRERQGEETTK